MLIQDVQVMVSLVLYHLKSLVVIIIDFANFIDVEFINCFIPCNHLKFITSSTSLMRSFD